MGNLPHASQSSNISRAAVVINNWTLVFADPQLEHAFRAHQRRVWSATELWRLKVNLLAGIINLSITLYLLSQVGLACGYGAPSHSLYGLMRAAVRQHVEGLGPVLSWWCCCHPSPPACRRCLPAGQRLCQHPARLHHPAALHDSSHPALHPGAVAARHMGVHPHQPPGRGEADSSMYCAFSTPETRQQASAAAVAGTHAHCTRHPSPVCAPCLAGQHRPVLLRAAAYPAPIPGATCAAHGVCPGCRCATVSSARCPCPRGCCTGSTWTARSFGASSS